MFVLYLILWLLWKRWDDSLDIEVPKAGRQLRELILAAHHVNSHAIHQFLIAADFVPENLMAAAINSVSEVRKNSPICSGHGGR